MATSTPAGLNQTMPPAFFQLYVNGQALGAGITTDFTELPEGQYSPVIGELLPIWEPGMRHGRGTYTRFQIYGGSLPDLLIAAGVTDAATVASTGVDLRFIALTIQASYTQPGGATKTVTLHGVQMTEWGTRIDRADQLIREYGSFQFQFWTQQ